MDKGPMVAELTPAMPDDRITERRFCSATAMNKGKPSAAGFGFDPLEAERCYRRLLDAGGDTDELA